MKKRILLLIGIISFLPQCGRIKPKKIFTPIQEQSEQRINISPEWTKNKLIYPQPNLDTQTITMNDAIAFGLQYNPKLQAHFENIGIRKSDLIQAGLYTNPHVSSVFKIPYNNKTIQTNIEIDATITLSDLWQVPLRKKVAQHNLEMETHEIMSEILKLRKNIQHAYFDCVYKDAYVSLIKEITALVQTIQKRIDYRYQFGFHTKLDQYFALSKLAEWQAKIIAAEAALDIAYTTLHQILGIPISSQKLLLTDSLTIPDINSSQKELEEYALNSHPYVLIEQSKVAKAKASINYERSRVIENAQIGIAYKRDFEKKTSGIGPSLAIDIPLFNTNYGNIERANFEMEQAEKKLLAQKRMIFTSISNQLISYTSYEKQLNHYNEFVIPPVIQAIEFSKDFFDTMQMSLIVFLDTQIELFQSKLKQLELEYKIAHEYVELEFSVGAQLNHSLKP